MPSLLSGTSNAVIAENVRSLRQQGLSEKAAVEKAAQFANQRINKTVADPDEEAVPDRQWIIVTKDFSGLGWAKKLKEEGEAVTIATQNKETIPADRQQFNRVGQNWISVMPLSEAMTKLRTPTTYWIFAENHFTETAEKLRSQGQKVFGTSTLSEKMEHDRQYAIEIAKDAGLPVPATHQFSTRADGLRFLDSHAETAYVFKPDDGKFNYLTFVPVRKNDTDANREVSTYLAHLPKEPGTYILQERIPIEKGTEVNVEVWLYDGEPFMAFWGLEVKRKNTYDIGEMSGCAGDFVQVLPIESKLVQSTIGLLLPFYKKQRYTGFADVNVILTKDGGPYFLEVCNRFGYNAHVTLFLALALDSFANIMADFVDGHIENMSDRFLKDIGCSMTLFVDHPREALPIHLDERWAHQCYLFDGYKDDGELFLSGYSDEIGAFVDRGATLEEAADAVWNKIVFEEAVSIPDMYYRTDLSETNYFNAPVSRYAVLKRRKLLT